MDRTRRRLGLLLLVTAVMAISPLTEAWSSGPPDCGLYVIENPQFFDTKCDAIRLTCVALSFSGNAGQVRRITARLEESAYSADGSWPVTNLSGVIRDRVEFEGPWSFLVRPGVLPAEQRQVVSRLAAALAAVRPTLMRIEIPCPSDASEGSRYSVRLEAVLESGRVLTTEVELVAQSLPSPSGWIVGDCHIHSNIGGHGVLSMTQIKSYAIGLGHYFTYLTDHLNLIRSEAQGWSGYYTNCQTVSTSTYTMAPGLEVSAVNGSGDALGYGFGPNDPTELENLEYTCSTLVSKIQQVSGRTATVAHPAGPTPWSSHACGYRGCQVVNDELANDATSYWQHDIASHITQCTPAAIGGSDFHTWYNSMGEATWAYGPAWFTASTWLAKKDAVASAIFNGKTSATDQGSLAFFILNGQYPGGSSSKATGATIYYDIKMYAIYNGYDVQMHWEIYRGTQRINYGSSPILESGSSYFVQQVPTTVQAGTKGYSIIVRFDYISDGYVQWSDEAFCGPIKVTGT